MQFVGKVISSVSEFYRDINPSTLSGAIDVVVVENIETGELICSPFHVRFGKLQLLRPQEKAVELKINGVSVGEELRMKVGEAGETFFVLSREELGMGGSDLPSEYLTSPLIGPETPAPLESIEEFKLKGSIGLSSTPNISNTTSPEWKWEWGDLPIKKTEDSLTDINSSQSTFTSVDSSIVFTPTLPEPTVELYEYLTGKDYLRRSHDILARFPPRSMITRIYKIDRGLHFQTLTSWPETLSSSSLLNESYRLLESDFLLNPNVVIEESSRLVYQFTWENKKVVLGGSVGAAVVFYAQTYSRILPIEIIQKLSEIAAIRMAKRIFNKSSEYEINSEEHAVVKAEESAVIKVVEPAVEETLVKTDETTTQTLNLADAAVPIDIPKEQGEGKEKDSQSFASSTSRWRSWWSRSSAAAATANPEKPVENENKSEEIPRPTTPVQITPQLVVSAESSSKSPSPVPKVKLELELPGTLSVLINDGMAGGGADGAVDKSPTKRIIQRTTSIASLNNSEAISQTSIMTSNTPISTTSTVNSSKKSCSTGSRQFIKSLRLPSHLLKKLNLKPGVNTISYTVNTRLQGTATCQSRIFLWRSDARVVISDIDGTITKSDALGHLFTMVGKDWTHVGVAQLYSKIAANGYEFLYLTSRAIGQAASTRGYLKGVEQDRLQLPDGPVIMSPDRLFTALHREVIQRRPDEFKIACLRDIQKLFVADDEEFSMMGSGVISSSEDEYSGVLLKDKLKIKEISSSTSLSKTNLTVSTAAGNQNPFYAGFGNRPTDTKSYKAVGISASRIFLINPAGDLKLDKLTFYTPYSASSYSKLTEEVDKVFPPVRSPSSLTRSAGDEAFTDFQYWHGAGGDVRMDLVQMALGTVAAASNPGNKTKVLVDGNGKPVSPVTLQKMQLESSSSVYSSSTDSSGTSVKMTPPELPPRNKSGEEADSEADDSEDEEDVMESIDSFPFI